MAQGSQENRVRQLIDSGKDFFRKRYFRNAMSCFEQAKEISPQNSEVLTLLAESICESNHGTWTDEAVSLLQQAFTYDPNHAGAWNNLGKKHYLDGKYLLAIQCFEKTLHLSPFNPKVMGNLACAFRMNNQYVEAFAILQKALEIAPRSPELHFHMGLTYLMRGVKCNSTVEFENAKQEFVAVKKCPLKFEFWNIPAWVKFVDIVLREPLNVLVVRELLNRFVPEHMPWDLHSSAWPSAQKKPIPVRSMSIH